MGVHLGDTGHRIDYDKVEVIFCFPIWEMSWRVQDLFPIVKDFIDLKFKD